MQTGTVARMPPTRTTWRDIAADLREAITRGDYSPGSRLPSQAKLIEQYGTSSQTLATALGALRREGLIRSLTGSGHYVRKRPVVMRSARTRLSQEEREAGRGTFITDAHQGGWTARTETEIHVQAASEEVAAALAIEVGSPVLVRDRLMYADDEPVQLATSYLPRDLTEGTQIEDENTGPGGIYARLEEAGHGPLHFEEYVRAGQAAEHEADQLNLPIGAPLLRVTRIAANKNKPVEVNYITMNGERYELFYAIN